MEKHKVIELVNSFPEEVDVKELLEAIVILQKVEEARESVKQGKLISHEEIKVRLNQLSKE